MKHSHDHLVFIIGIPIPGKKVFILRPGPVSPLLTYLRKKTDKSPDSFRFHMLYVVLTGKRLLKLTLRQEFLYCIVSHVMRASHIWIQVIIRLVIDLAPPWIYFHRKNLLFFAVCRPIVRWHIGPVSCCVASMVKVRQSTWLQPSCMHWSVSLSMSWTYPPCLRWAPRLPRRRVPRCSARRGVQPPVSSTCPTWVSGGRSSGRRCVPHSSCCWATCRWQHLSCYWPPVICQDCNIYLMR